MLFVDRRLHQFVHTGGTNKSFRDIEMIFFGMRVNFIELTGYKSSCFQMLSLVFSDRDMSSTISAKAQRSLLVK
jgi:hypothetical protein